MTAAAPYGPPTPAPSHIGGWCWSVPGAAGIEATREAVEAQIRKHREARQ